MKEVESETTITSPAPVDNNGSIVCIGDGHTETTQCSGEVADEADSVHELHDDENIATAIPETELEDAAYSETPPESPVSRVSPEAVLSPRVAPNANVEQIEVQTSNLFCSAALPEDSPASAEIESTESRTAEPTTTQVRIRRLALNVCNIVLGFDAGTGINF